MPWCQQQLIVFSPSLYINPNILFTPILSLMSYTLLQKLVKKKLLGSIIPIFASFWSLIKNLTVIFTKLLLIFVKIEVKVPKSGILGAFPPPPPPPTSSLTYRPHFFYFILRKPSLVKKNSKNILNLFFNFCG